MPDHTVQLLNHLGIEFTTVADWSGPIWDAVGFTFDQRDQFGDIGHFHEVMHYLVAEEWQRENLDFALGRNVNGVSGSWSSSVWPADPVEWVDAGEYESWSDEDRVCLRDAALQESYSVWAMGLYDLLFSLTPEEHAELLTTMDWFGAWSTQQGPLMTTEAVQVIADCIVPQIGQFYPQATVESVIAHLMGYQTEPHRQSRKSAILPGFLENVVQ